jgi:hypothetical protein
MTKSIFNTTENGDIAFTYTPSRLEGNAPRPLSRQDRGTEADVNSIPN